MSASKLSANAQPGASPAPASPPRGPLRKGKWTAEEEAYTNQIIRDFSNGLLPLGPGTTLRSYLSEKLNCDPMRITKKFAGNNCIGKQVFQPCERTPENLALVESSKEALRVLEGAFHAKLKDPRGRRGSSAAASSGLSGGRSAAFGTKSLLPGRAAKASPTPSSFAGDETDSMSSSSSTDASVRSFDDYVANDDCGNVYRRHFRSYGRDRAVHRAYAGLEEYSDADKDAGGLLLDFFETVRQRAAEFFAQEGSTEREFISTKRVRDAESTHPTKSHCGPKRKR